MRKYVNQQLEKMSDPEERIKAAAHLYGVLAATMISEKDIRTRSLLLWRRCCMTHNAGENGDARIMCTGAVLAEEILKKLALTDEEETKTICPPFTIMMIRHRWIRRWMRFLKMRMSAIMS